MNLNDLKIGYVPYLPDLSQPGDRRRFPYFARRHQIPFEVASPDTNYDIILLTAPSNLSMWLAYKDNHPHTKFLFEMVDSLLFAPNLFTKYFKGVGRYLLKKEDRLYLNYLPLLHKWIAISDLVICSNTVLKNEVGKLNPATIVSPDYLEGEYDIQKKDFHIHGKMQIVWEGQAAVLPNFLAFTELFKRIESFCELNLITEPYYPTLPKVWKTSIHSFLRRLPITSRFYPWEMDTHSSLLAKGDCAIIPLDKKNRMGWNKPANKLVSFWFTGLPVVTSATPAYTELMRDANTGLYCDTIDEWVANLQWIYELTPQERMELALSNYRFAKDRFSDTQVDKIWEEIFRRITE